MPVTFTDKYVDILDPDIQIIQYGNYEILVIDKQIVSVIRSVDGLHMILYQAQQLAPVKCRETTTVN